MMGRRRNKNLELDTRSKQKTNWSINELMNSVEREKNLKQKRKGLKK